MPRKDYDRTVVHLFGRDFQGSSLIAAALWWVGALVALLVGLTAWSGGVTVAVILALVGLMVALAG